MTPSRPLSRFSDSSRLTRHILRALVTLAWFAGLPALVFGQANVKGKWQTLTNLMPINPVHATLLRNGKVLIVSGSGNVAGNTNFQAGVFDPQTGTVTTQPITWDMFCNGMVVLPDGRAFINSGTLQYDPFHGELRSAIYDQNTGIFTDIQNMAHGRWYPTVTNLGDGSLMTFSGLDENGNTNSTVEVYSVSAGWSAPVSSPFTPPLYPRMTLLPSGKVFYSGSTTQSRLFDPSTKTWSGVIASTNYSGTRTYGTSVLLPLTPANNYKPVVMILGGGSPATPTTEYIDLSAASPKWTNGPAMSQSRIEMNATILPNGKVIALGGSLNDEDTSTASLNADLFAYDTTSNTLSVASAGAGANAYARLYHSVSVLLPDATVWFAGGNPARGTYEQHMEIYSPAYLFNPDGSLATRPTISGVSPSGIGYGSTFQVQTPNAATISSVVLVRPGAPTHAFDMEQRLVAMNFTAGSNVLNVTAPPNGNIAPPGYYMLFILNSSGVPSVASMVQLSTAGSNQAPTGTITAPASNVTINAGQSVFFSGTGSDPDGTIGGYAWSFPGGSPSSSSLANPGNVIYGTPGTYVATLTVTDNLGLTDPNPPTRTITVQPDFTLSLSPNLNTVSPGGATSYAATIATTSGFSGTVSFSATGLPTGATAAFNPTTVTGSGSSTMTVTTSTSTPIGTYTLTVTGTSGSLSHSATVNLNVTSGAPPSIRFVQVNSAVPQSPQSTVTIPFTLAQAAGDLNVVVVGWNDSSATVNSVTDTKGNIYAPVAAPVVQSGVASQAIYYAKNIVAAAANANTVTVKFNGSANFADIRIAEYGGIDQINPLDVSAGAQGNGATASSGTITTTNANDLLVGADIVQTGTSGAGSGYTTRIITNPDSDILEDTIVSTIGSYSATAPVSPSAPWIMQMVAFKAAGSVPTPTAPSNLAATAAGPVQINLSWTAATEIGGSIANYLIERCSGASCSSFAQVGTSTGTTYGDAGLIGSTSYSYRVRAVDAVNVTGPYSNTASATTAAPTFTAPSNLTGTAAGPVQVNLSWTAATESGGTITNYLIERCSGACSSFTQVGTSATTTFSNTGLLGSTAYTYRVRATDGTNFSGYSSTASATTAAPTFTAPSNLTATAASNTQINLSWTAATESGGTITNYLIERCQGAGCSNFTQVATSATTTSNDTGLLAGTTYSYRVRATDAASNLGPYSNVASAATTAAPPPAIAFVQGNYATPQTPQSTVAVTFTLAQGAGNLNVIIIGWNDSTATVSSVTDTKANNYVPVAPALVLAGTASQAIYYAKNIGSATAGSNIVTVKFNVAAAYPDIRILEYSGIDITNPLDVTAAASGNSASASSGAVTTTNANDLIIGANLVQTGTPGPGSGFTSRIITVPDSDIAEDMIVTATGSYAATSPVSPAAPWIMHMVAFKRHP